MAQICSGSSAIKPGLLIIEIPFTSLIIFPNDPETIELAGLDFARFLLAGRNG